MISLSQKAEPAYSSRLFWFVAFESLAAIPSSHNYLSVQQDKTAWRMMQQLRFIVAEDDTPLTKKVEMDEAYWNQTYKTSLMRGRVRIQNCMQGCLSHYFANWVSDVVYIYRSIWTGLYGEHAIFICQKRNFRLAYHIYLYWHHAYFAFLGLDRLACKS